jgi:hypothetical protein
VAVHHGAQHHVFRQLVGFRFNHQHGTFGTGHDQIQFAGLQFGGGRVEHILAIDVTDARGAHRAVKGRPDRARAAEAPISAGMSESTSGLADITVATTCTSLKKPSGKQRANRTIDQATDQRFLGRVVRLALQEAAGNAAGGIGLFLVIDSQRKEILAGLDFVLGHHGDQHHGVVHVDDDGAGGLAGNFAGFQGDCMTTVLE